jgi:hypothetical protein
MKETFDKTRVIGCQLMAGCVLMVMLVGCGGDEAGVVSQQQVELDGLRAERREVDKLRAENQELDRLRRDNAEAEELRRSVGEIAAIRAENEKMRNDLVVVQRDVKLSRQQILEEQAALAAAQAAGQGVVTDPNAPDPDLPMENDEIWVDPRMLGKLFPDFDWEKIQRTEPIAISQLLQQQGIVLTNYQQLVEIGITNYTIKRQKAAPTELLPQ